MNEFQLMGFLRRCGEDFLIPSFAVCAVVYIIGKHPSVFSERVKNYATYISGILFYFIYSLITKDKVLFEDCFNLGITCGGIATVILSTICPEKKDTAYQIRGILLLMMDADKVPCAVKKILKLGGNDISVIETEIQKIIAECRKNSLNAEEEKLLVSLMANILSERKNSEAEKPRNNFKGGE